MAKRTSREPSARQAPRRSRLGCLLAVLALLLCAALFVRHRTTRVATVIRQAQEALDSGELRRAQALAALAVKRAPDSNPAHFLAGQAAAALGEFDGCLISLEQVDDDGTPAAVEARCLAGDVLLLHFKRLSEAEQQFRRALEQDPANLQAHDHLAFALGVGARPWEQIPHRLRLIAGGRFEPPHLQSLSLGSSALENDDMVADYHRSNRDDPLPRLMMARLAIENQKLERAEAILREALEIDPNLIEGHAKLGRVLLQRDALDKLPAWHAALPPAADEHPDIWAARGEWARRTNKTKEAARCFWEAIKRNPEHEMAIHQLGRLLVELDRAEDAAPFLERAEQLQKYVNSVISAAEMRQPDLYRAAANLAEQLGLVWEAYAWHRVLLSEQPSDRGAEQNCERLRQRFEPDPKTRSVAAAHLTDKLDLTALPLPSWAGAAAAAAQAGPAAGAATLANQAANAGIDFQYFNSGNPQQGIARMQEFSGGGAAALDYDGDSWPDLYLTQGCAWGEQGRQTQHLDRLYRNRGDGKFEDVTELARLFENGFGQGVTVGDFDNDGFPDVFVANIGANRFYHNNGDGTFTDITAQTGTAGDRWSTSCVLADFNGDGLPDLYTVNYLSGDNVFTQECRTGEGRGAACFPQFFPAAQDELYVNRGDGRFGDATESGGIVADDGKGLGIIACDLEQSGRLSLFVANDTLANFLYANQSAPGGPLLFRDEAVLRGVAMNERGKFDACMGIAAGDMDDNGLLDLFVTNFYDESNTLYLQQAGGLFADRTAQALLHAPSLKQLGFGTQLVDFDLDGRLDLFVTNGHIGDERPDGIPYQMPPQLFQNTGQGRFREAPAEEVGPYMRGQYLGRAVARWDWNKDGAEDLVVGHLDAPVALLTNTTRPRGRHLAVHLRATSSARDAIGATVRVTAGDRSMVRQLIAGDGYQASNERRLVFGLGDARRIDAVEVTWLRGGKQSFSGVALDSEIVIIEDREEPIVIGAAVAAPAPETD